ncbi:MAG TPA: thioredoxin family protein [Abditibacterium sp.]|jgi:thiol:disulfide interchange protein
MKKLSILLTSMLASAAVLPASAQAAPAKKSAAQVKWHPTYASALAEAKRSGKPIFVDVFTTWCGPCKYLDAVTYKDPKFVAESRKWVMVKVDAEKGAQNIQLASKFRVTGYPTMLFLRPNGQEAGRAVGGYPANLLVPAMKKAGEKAGGGKSI